MYLVHGDVLAKLHACAERQWGLTPVTSRGRCHRLEAAAKKCGRQTPPPPKFYPTTKTELLASCITNDDHDERRHGVVAIASEELSTRRLQIFAADDETITTDRAANEATLSTKRRQEPTRKTTHRTVNDARGLKIPATWRLPWTRCVGACVALKWAKDERLVLMCRVQIKEIELEVSSCRAGDDDDAKTPYMGE
jgi:hypothetical protein